MSDEDRVIGILRFALAAIYTELEVDGPHAQRIANDALDMTSSYACSKQLNCLTGFDSWTDFVKREAEEISHE